MLTNLKKPLYQVSAIISFLIPLFASAQFAPTPSAFDDVIFTIQQTLNDFVLPFLFVLATVLFIWGVIMYIAQSDDETARKKARGLMMWGIIGLAVILTVWGITALLVKYFGVGGEVIPGTTGSLIPIPTQP